MNRFAKASWQGSGKEGKGSLTTQSTILNNTKYSHSSRFANSIGTNPEELVAAAHAGCFTMKLSVLLSDAGFRPENIETRCDIIFSMEKDVVTDSHLTVTAKVPGIDKMRFERLVEDARVNCPMSRLLKANITCRATLVQEAINAHI